MESVTTYYRAILHNNPHLPAEYIQQLLEQQPLSQSVIDTIVLSCQRLILRIAVKIKRIFPYVPLMDLITESNLKLLKNIYRFDTRRNVKFSTYISVVIYRHLKAFAASYRIWSLKSFDETSTKPEPEPEATEALNALRAIILKHLGKRDATVIFERYGLLGNPKTLAEIGENLAITRERVRQIEYRALRRLRNIIKTELPQLTPDGQRYSRNGHTIHR